MSGAFDIYLKIDGIQGESTARGHEKEIIVRSYEQAVDATVTSGGGGGGATGKATFSGARFRKPLDKASIPLMLACATGKHIKSARFAFRRQGSNSDYYTITLEEISVTHIAQRAGDGPQFPLSFESLNQGAAVTEFLEDVTLHYSRIKWHYLPLGPDGRAGSPIDGGWDIKANKKL